jgi:hypothetical protein
LLTMACLAAVRPNWLSVTNSESGSGKGSIYVCGSDRHTTGLVSQGCFTS